MHILRRIVFYGLLVLIALAPLPFGSNRPWAWSILSLWVGVLVLLDAVSAGFDPVRGESRFMRRIALPFLLFLPVIIWIIHQATPDIFTNIAHPIWSEASAQLGQLLPNYVTISPEMTWDALMVLLSYAGVFWLAARHGRDRKNASAMLRFFVIVSTCYAIYGLVVFFGGWEKILWFDKTSYLLDVTSTFINRNSYATFSAMSTIVSFSAAVLSENRYSSFGGGSVSSKHKYLIEFLQEKFFYLSAFFVNLTALFLTHSRAGLFSFAVAMAVVCVVITVLEKSQRNIKFVMMLSLCFSCAGIFLMSGSGTVERVGWLFSSTSEVNTRLTVFKNVLLALDSVPYTGYGYGVFEEGFRVHKTAYIGWGNWQHAHNSYLEIAFGGGFLMLGAFILIHVFLAVRLYKGAQLRRRGRVYPVLALGSLVVIFVHSIVDFSVQIYAVGVTFCLLLGSGVLQSSPTLSSRVRTH